MTFDRAAVALRKSTPGLESHYPFGVAKQQSDSLRVHALDHRFHRRLVKFRQFDGMVDGLAQRKQPLLLQFADTPLRHVETGAKNTRRPALRVQLRLES